MDSLKDINKMLERKDLPENLRKSLEKKKRIIEGNKEVKK